MQRVPPPWFLTVLVVSVFVLVTCQDYDLIDQEDDDYSPPPGDDDVVEDDDTVEDDDSTPPEECEVELATGQYEGVDEDCEGYDPGKVADPWDLAVEWQDTSVGKTVSMPAVGNLTDDNFDGNIDDLDSPDIVITEYNYSNSRIIALHGDGSGIIWTVSGFAYDSGVAIADVDDDGDPEVVGITSGNRIQSVAADGTVEWTSADSFSMLYPVPTVADVDADGMPDVIGDAGIVSGLDGSTIASLTPASPSLWRAPVAADIDQDGDMEIILANTVFDHTGTQLWTASGSGTSCFNAVVQADSDDEAEVVFAYGPSLALYEHDGTLLGEVSLPGSYNHPGPPCVGDLDGDGEAEIAIPSGTQLSAYELDGTFIWGAPMNDSSGAAGCSVFDMNGDLTYEVIFADQVELMILDGTTGTLQYSNSAHGSVTYFEYPVIADVDLDGSAEIVTASSGSYGYAGVTVFGHGGSGWPESGATWAVHDFAVVNVESDGSVPTNPDPSWLKYNVFRGRPSADHAGLPDLVVEITDWCTTTCDPGGFLKIAYQVSNLGEGDVDAGVILRMYMVNGAVETFYDQRIMPMVPEGWSIDGEEWVVPVDDLGTTGLILAIDDDGFGGDVYECKEDNNEYELFDICSY